MLTDQDYSDELSPDDTHTPKPLFFEFHRQRFETKIEHKFALKSNGICFLKFHCSSFEIPITYCLKSEKKTGEISFFVDNETEERVLSAAKGKLSIKDFPASFKYVNFKVRSLF